MNDIKMKQTLKQLKAELFKLDSLILKLDQGLAGKQKKAA